MRGRRALRGYALVVYAFLYAPIVVIVVLAFNKGRQVQFTLKLNF